jgi:tRNA A58 N-methylase Trm61
MTVLEPGPGMGFFTLELARIVGPAGRVIAVDVQPKMIETLRRRATKANLSRRIDAHVVGSDSMQLDEVVNIDFVLAFAVVHEMPDAATFFSEVAEAMKPGARMLLAEPSAHVSVQEFEAELELASRARLERGAQPLIRRSRTAVLRKSPSQEQKRSGSVDP